MKRITWAIGLLVAFAAPGQSTPVPAITTIPASGDVSGAPGDTVGWGFQLTFSDPSNWVVLNDSYFTGAQVYGGYQDYIVSQFIVAGPAPESSPVTVNYVHSSSGLGEFDIYSFAPPGASITGNINVDYCIFSQDPNDPSFDPASFVTSGVASAAVDVTVPAAVPEPRTAFLLMAAIALALWRRFVTRHPAGNASSGS